MVTAYLEDGLSRSDRRRLEKHLAGCPLCTEYLAQIRETIRLAAGSPDNLSPEMRSDLTEVSAAGSPTARAPGRRTSGTGLPVDALFQADRDHLPASLPIDLRRPVLIGSLCVPSPRAMKELWNGLPSTVPRTFTSPPVPSSPRNRA